VQGGVAHSARAARKAPACMKALGIELNPVWQYRLWFVGLLYVSVVVEAAVLFVRHRRAPSIPRSAANVLILGVEVMMRGVTFSLRYALGLLLAGLAPMHFRWTLASSI